MDRELLYAFEPVEDLVGVARLGEERGVRRLLGLRFRLGLFQVGDLALERAACVAREPQRER